MAGEAARPADGATPGRIFHVVSDGWPSAQSRAIWAEHIGRGAYLREPLFPPIQALALRRGLCSRDQAVEDRAWFGSTYYNETQRVCEIDEMLLSLRDLPGGRRQGVLFLFRPLGGGASSAASVASSGSSHEELGRHYGSALATLDDPSPAWPDPPAPPDPPLPARGRRREAGRRPARPEHRDRPRIRPGPLPALPRLQPARAHGLFPPPLRPPAPRSGRRLTSTGPPQASFLRISLP